MSIMRIKYIAVQVSLVALLTFHARAFDFSLANRNSSMDVNITNASAGIQNLTVDGVDYLKNQWFYYRVGGGPEAPIQNISSSPTISVTTAFLVTTLNLTYANSSYSVLTSLKLSGSTTGSAKGNLNEVITVNNLSVAPLDFHFFQYSDFDLYGATGGQSVQFLTNSANGADYKAYQTDGTHRVTESMTSTVTPIGHFEAGYYNDTLVSLTDGASTTLSDATSAGVGDVTFAYQWDVTVAPGGSFQLSKLIEIAPEPSSVSFLAVAALASAIYRRRK